MELSWATYRIECTHPFGLSRGTVNYYDIVYIYLTGDGFIGRGEAAPSKRYDESTSAIVDLLEKGIEIPSLDDEYESWENKLTGQTIGIKALESALSMAALDWWCQRDEIPLHQLLHANKDATPQTSFTVAIGDLDEIPQKIKEAKPYAIIKVKLGTDEDKEIINAVRGCTDKPIRVDANEGWTLAQGIEMCQWLSERNVQFVEQPLPSDSLDESSVLRDESPLPIFADENSISAEDIPKIAYAFDGINIKLMKCGSLFEAKRMIESARKHDLKIMLGCMVESSIGITAAAHLSPLVDFADLDGNLLISNDPYQGVSVENGKLVLPDGNGAGITLRSGIEGLI
ncbi:MAG: dipeptide epimerase [Candidatus Marinimicrobia bacterium]|nr:dipeptide epimerase [Candidatus Neomarinimicrobiota bacterium]MBT3618577.1 dipeptide epimerase [Candidatus Neomarinimicrobiota bacterium]MBT3828804.1 dipeptide epimerase [Candidatus Neomarinimicrobiota bacterium]MBT3996834.1 dipeptide epimerase [Candidatus Neomarinimicrobiota bacterium]MBT4281015.1 dipeptide epimerase [Candidatus Neomarinimicrobiota bacterium]